eukprot:9857279-Karenia_brevis.AAC.1
MNDEERQLRWQRHFAGLFKGTVVENLADIKTTLTPRVVQAGSHRPSHQQCYNAIFAQPNDKALGPDEIPAELWKAGGHVSAAHFHRLLCTVFDTCYAPLAWRGGRIQDLFKNKGSQMECNNSRGLLISDHLAKSFTTILKDASRDQYESFVHEEQCGCIRKRGTEFATHL